MDNIVAVCVEACRATYDDTAPGVNVDDLRFTVSQQADDSMLVAFRGTTCLTNWLEDAESIPELTPRHHLGHGGFVNAYRKLLPAVTPFLAGGVVVTGHSLGGAIAVLFAEQLGCSVVTFGCPKVYFDNEDPPALHHIRIVHQGDPVPDLPPFFYRHDCDPVILYDDDNLLEIHDHFIDGYAACIIKQEGGTT
jgi:hypothetical protein